MKNITKKEWGIVSTSIGSILIIVALLTMVGIGSNDTYASTTATQCTCTSGTYDLTTNKCAVDKTYQCCAAGSQCENDMGFKTCENTTYCTAVQGGLYNCSRELTNCTCPGGTYLNSNGACVENVGNCPAGTYYQGQNHAATCPAGSYCPGGTYNAETGEIKEGCEKIACPAGSYCPEGVSEPTICPAGYYCPEGVSEPTKCPAGKTTNTTGAKSDTYCIDGGCTSIGAKCTLNGKSGTCIDSGSNVGGLVCKIETSGSDDGPTCTSIGAKCTLNGKSGTCIDSGSNVGGLVCKIETSGSDDGGDSSTPSGGDSSSGGNSSTPSGGDSGGNGNANQNPNTATKTPLVIAIIGTMSMALGTFAYFKGKKEINTEI